MSVPKLFQKVYKFLILMNKIKTFLIVISFFFFGKLASADIIKKIEILGNERISDQTILMFSNVQLNDKFNLNKSN